MRNKLHKVRGARLEVKEKTTNLEPRTYNLKPKVTLGND